MVTAEPEGWQDSPVVQNGLTDPVGDGSRGYVARPWGGTSLQLFSCQGTGASFVLCAARSLCGDTLTLAGVRLQCLWSRLGPCGLSPGASFFGAIQTLPERLSLCQALHRCPARFFAFLRFVVLTERTLALCMRWSQGLQVRVVAVDEMISGFTGVKTGATPDCQGMPVSDGETCWSQWVRYGA